MPYRFVDETFDCILQTKKCKMCRRKVTLGLDLCWQHARMEYKVKMGESRIPNAGKGLFAMRPFKKNEWICPYGGEHITEKTLDRRYPGDALGAYVEKVDKNTFYDAACRRGIGSIANGSPTSQNSNVVAMTRYVGKSPWLRATRNIRTGEELINNYGDEYFLGNISSNVTRYMRPKRSSRRSRKS